jgi:4-hydroxybenzoate polyprenyltransferase
MTFKAVLIGLFGFEGGLVLNDYVDRKGDKLDVEGALTAYWRPFQKKKPDFPCRATHRKIGLYPFSRSRLFMLRAT